MSSESRDRAGRIDRLQARQEGETGEPGGETMRVPVNVYEAGEALVVVAPLPGVRPEDVNVSVDGAHLRIAAAMRSAAAKDYLVHEWHYGPYEREVDLPAGFGGGGMATFGNGQLAIRLTRGEGGGGRIEVKPA
ncbi:MAG TPA: Hsp20/alpha crystallin family protein [Acidimicrobiales bacterium]|nr:Hsp20/alpha crystallin family protein [Acidimicrobiales bacterium]